MPQPPEPEGRTHALRGIISTFSREEQAADAVRTLVRERLVACGTLLRGARSIYAWQGNLEDAEEVVALLKTTAAAVPAAAARLKELHPYDVPEILVVTVESVEPAYAKWIADSVSA